MVNIIMGIVTVLLISSSAIGVLFFLKRKSEIDSNPNIPDPWQHSGGFYVAKFRRYLDEIAEVLSRDERPVRSCFNLSLKCAELHTPEGEVIARVVVNGSECAPTGAVVTATSLSSDLRALFIRVLPIHVTFETVT